MIFNQNKTKAKEKLKLSSQNQFNHDCDLTQNN